MLLIIRPQFNENLLYSILKIRISFKTGNKNFNIPLPLYAVFSVYGCLLPECVCVCFVYMGCKLSFGGQSTL